MQEINKTDHGQNGLKWHTNRTPDEKDKVYIRSKEIPQMEFAQSKSNFLSAEKVNLDRDQWWRS